MNSSFASSFSNIPFYSSSSSSSEMVVTREEFNAFHKIDRALFSRLVLGLKRDINQSIEVFAFLFLLEQAGYVRNLIAYLVSLPDASIDAVANEIVVCLTFLYNKDYSTTFFVANNNSDGQSIIPTVSRMTGGRITLIFIHQNRESFLVELRKNLNDICIRAFEDICVRAKSSNREKALALEREKVINDMKEIRLNVQREPTNRMNVRQEWVPVTTTDVEEETNKRKEKVKEEEEEVVLAPDDRTVFLIFSKGYPISEEEVRVHFTKIFGEVIEAVEMQEVEDNEKFLYAKMVLKMRYAWKMEDIVNERSRNKFTINGKQVWASKNVPKDLSSASSSFHA